MRRALLAIGMTLLAACAPASGRPAGDAATEPSRGSAASLSDPIDVEAYLERARLAFYDVGGRLEGGDRHYRASVGDDGVALVGFHRPEGEPERTSARLLMGAPRAYRGGLELDRPAGSPVRREDGSVAIERGWAREELVNGERGVEQRWHFPAAPAGEGPLVLRIEAPSLQRIAADEAGLHLAPARGELGLVYGHATWIDAAGARAAIEARWREGGVELELTAEVLARTRWPAVLDPVIGPEVGPGVSTYVPAPGAQLGSDVAVASGGTALAVWRDARRGPYDVFATRVAPSGLSPLDSVGFLVSEPTSASVGSAAVAFGGGAFLVAWTHAGRVLVRRVATSGAFVDATPIVVREATGASSIDVVFDGTDFVLAWSEGATGSLDLFAARVTTDALVRDATPLVLSNAPGSQSGVRLASSAGTTHAVWTDTRTDTGDVYGAYIASGTVTDGGVIATGTGYQGAPAITAGAGTMLVAWQETDLGVVRLVALDPTGWPAGTPRIVASGGAMGPRLASSTTGHLIAWHEGSGTRITYAATLTATGGAGSSPVELGRSSSGGPESIAYDGGNYLVTSTRSVSSATDLYLSRVYTSGLASSAVMLTNAAQPQTSGRVAESGGSYLMVWAIDRGGYEGTDIFGMRVDSAGGVLDVSPLGIVTEDDDQTSPDVAGDGLGGWLVAWVARRPASGGAYFTDVRGRRVTAAGTMSGAFDIARGGVAGAPAVGGGPSGYVVLHRNYPDIVATRVGRTSGVLGSHVLGPAPYYNTANAVVWDGTAFQLAWVSTPSSWEEIWGARLTPDGAVAPAGGRQLVSFGPGTPRNPALAAGGGSVLLTWMQFESTARQNVRALRLDAAGAPIGSPFVVTTTSANALYPSATFEGTDFFVSWDRERGASTAVEGARVTTAGVVREPDGVPIVSDASGSELSSGGGGRAIILYHGFTFGPTTNARQVRARIIDFTVPGELATGAACTSSWTCASGECVDGVCCDRACRGGCEVCAAARGASADGACTILPAAQVCRAAAGVCDVQELCDGVSGECPPDAFVGAGTSCGAPATDVCDVDDVCTGTSAACATTARRPAGTVCRPAVGECDAVEVCSGSSAACPADVVRAAGEVCRDAGGDCDVAESCDGSGVACPTDLFVAARTTCRAARADCDRTETCTGSDPSCPADSFAAAGVVCRSARDACDAEERCSGLGAHCPADAPSPAGTVCRAADGACDVAEMCDGRSIECPADAVLPRGSICRPAVGPCDVAEACDGAYPRCSIDRSRRDGASCDDGLICNGTSTCQAGACVAGEAIACAAGQCVEVLGACHSPPPPGCGCRASGARAGHGWASLLIALALVRRRR